MWINIQDIEYTRGFYNIKPLERHMAVWYHLHLKCDYLEKNIIIHPSAVVIHVDFRKSPEAMSLPLVIVSL